MEIVRPKPIPHKIETTDFVKTYVVENTSFNTYDHAKKYADEKIEWCKNWIEKRYERHWNEFIQRYEFKFGCLETKEEGEQFIKEKIERDKKRFEIKEKKTQYFSQKLYTDITPYELVRVVTDKTVEIRELDHKVIWRDQNDEGQIGEYKSNPSKPIIRIRAKKRGYGWSRGGAVFYPVGSPFGYYDYKF